MTIEEYDRERCQLCEQTRPALCVVCQLCADCCPCECEAGHAFRAASVCRICMAMESRNE